MEKLAFTLETLHPIIYQVFSRQLFSSSKHLSTLHLSHNSTLIASVRNHVGRATELPPTTTPRREYHASFQSFSPILTQSRNPQPHLSLLRRGHRRGSHSLLSHKLSWETHLHPRKVLGLELSPTSVPRPHADLPAPAQRVLASSQRPRPSYHRPSL
jgi:hypothetical protein